MGKQSQKAEQIKRDIAELHGFGYAQQLFRDMGGYSNFAISFSIISILTGAVTLYGYGWNMGGPAVMGIGWPIVTIFTIMVAAGMAEMASAIPTSGALYHWSSVLGGPGWGWFTAWFNVIGQFSITAGIDFGAAMFAVPLLGLKEVWGNFLLIYGMILLSHGLLNHFGIRIVAWLNDLSATWHMLGVAVLVAALLIFAPKQDVSFIFKTGLSTAKYPYWWAFLLGLLQAQWTYTGYDASAHITEETINPRVRAAWGIYLSVAVSAFFGFIMLMAVTLAVKDVGAVAGASNSYIYIIEQALGGTAGRAILWVVTIAMWFCGLSSVTSNSRMLFAFSRDNGLPFSGAWSSISKRYRTPAAAVWLSVAIAFLIAVYSGAYSVIVSISTIGLYVSYGLPLLLKLAARATGRWRKEFDGPWNLGALSPIINALAIAWIALITVLFVMPPNQITGYTFVGILAILIFYYLVSVRKWFKGPRRLGSEDELESIEREIETTSIYKEIGR
ncbi:MAG: amino acid permease [Firmicutes bacterium]|nr:amino acid permease [Bacillota bacterium]